MRAAYRNRNHDDNDDDNGIRCFRDVERGRGDLNPDVG
jgi:hypothetical protein